MRSQMFVARNNTIGSASVFRRHQALSFLRKRRFLLSLSLTAITLLAINAGVCASEQLPYTKLSQRLLLSKDGILHSLNELLRRCFDGNHRLLTIAAQGQTLPEEVIRESHNRDISCPLIIIRGDKLKEIDGRTSETPRQTSDMFILFVDTFHQVATLLANVKSLGLWNPRGRFVVALCYPLLDNTKASIQYIFQRMWSEKILEVVLVYSVSSSEHSNDVTSCSLLTSNMQVASYNPFKPFKSINNVTDIWSKPSSVEAFFPSLRNLNGYPLRAAMFRDPLGALPVYGSNGRIQIFEGYDGHMVHYLAQHMNAGLVFVPQNDSTLFGTRDENGTITGTCGDVANGRADIAPNSQYIKTDFVELEYTYPHDANSLCFLVPKSERVPQFRNLSLPFPYCVWVVMLCALVVTSLSWRLVRKYGEMSVKGRSTRGAINEAFFDIFRSFITGSFNEAPGSTLGRVFIVTWLMLAGIITNAYQGSLTSYLAVPKYLPEINTLRQLDKSPLGIFVPPGVKSFLTLDINDKIMKNLWTKFKHNGNISCVADRIARKRDMAGLFNALAAGYFLRNSRYIKDGYPLLHRVQQNILSIYSVYAVPRHSPFLPRFNVIISRLVEAGLQAHWTADSLHRVVLAGQTTAVSQPQAAEPAALGLTHLQTAFYLLLIGLLCSTLVFMLQRKMQAL